MLRVFLVAAAASLMASCASSGSTWSASSWNGVPTKTVGNTGYQWLASPIEGQGFKLKFTTKFGGNVGTASAGPAPDDALEAAAIEAAPDGCVFVALERDEAGGATADYDCD